jgi:hypothetical protein
MIPYRRATLLLLVATMLTTILAFVGCDTAAPAEEPGDFNGNVDGAIAGQIEGTALQRDVDGVLLTITASTADTPCSVEISVSSVRPPDTLFRELEGVYAVTDASTSTENRRLVRADVEIEATNGSATCAGYFRGQSGEVRVEQATPNRLDGALSIEATSNSTANAPTDTVTVDGEFSAVRRQVEG